jgi:hypothetical protein
MMNEQLKSLRLLIKEELEQLYEGDDGYIQVGDMSEPVAKLDKIQEPGHEPEFSAEDKQQLELQRQTVTQQRQAALNKGDAKSADQYGMELQRLEDMLG